MKTLIQITSVTDEQTDKITVVLYLLASSAML